MNNQTSIDTSCYREWTHRSLARTLCESYSKQVETGQRESVLILGDTHAGKTAAVHTFCDAMVDELKLTDANEILGCDRRYIQAHLPDERSVASENLGWDRCFFVWEWEPHRSFNFLADCSTPHGVVLVDWISLNSEGRSQVAQSLSDLEAHLPPQVLVVATLLSPAPSDRAQSYYQAADDPSLQFDEQEWKSFERLFSTKGVLKPDPSEWLEDFAPGKVHPDIIAFVKTAPERLLGLSEEYPSGWQRMFSGKFEALSASYQKIKNDYAKGLALGKKPVREWIDTVRIISGGVKGCAWAGEFIDFLMVNYNRDGSPKE